MRGVFVLVLFIVFSNGFGQTIWLETFNSYGDDIDDPGDGSWSVNTIGGNLGTFSVQSQEFFSQSTPAGIFIWESEPITITSTPFNISFLANSSGGGLDFDDYLQATYEIDGGIETQFFQGNDDFGPTTVISGDLSGSSLIIRIYTRTSFTDEYYTFDNVHVFQETGERHAITDGNWSDGSIWALTSGGSIAYSIPNENTDTYTDGYDVTIDEVANTQDLSVNGGNVLFSNGWLLTINKGGTVTIDDGSSINRGATLGDISFDNGTDFILEINDGTTGLNIDEFYIDDISTLTIQGSGIIDVNDDIELRSNNVAVINDLTGEINLNGEGASNVFVNAANCEIVNNGAIINNNTLGGIYLGINTTITNNGSFDFYILNYNNNNSIVNNYGTINQTNDFTFAGNGQAFNLDNATWNWSGTSSSNLNLHASFTGNSFNYNRSTGQSIITPQDSYYNLELSTGGTKTAQADFEVKGDWLTSANASFGGNFEVIFSGISDQTITNNNTGIQNFYNLTINKAGGNLLLNSNVTIANKLTMSSGNVITNGFRFYLDGEEAIDLEHTGGWIIGAFERDVSRDNQIYYFPIGTTEKSFKSAIYFNSISTPGSIIYEFLEEDPGEVVPSLTDPDDAFDITDVLGSGYWEMTSNGLVGNILGYGGWVTGFSPDSISASSRMLQREGSVPGAWEIRGMDYYQSDDIIARYLPTPDGILNGTLRHYGIGNGDCLEITNQPISVATCSGSGTEATFSVNTPIIGTMQYQWYFNGSATGTNSNILTISDISDSDVGNYRCRITTNACGNDTIFSKYAGLSINDPFSSLGFTFEKTITIDENKVSGNENLIDFPLLYSVTDPDLRTAPNGGVENASGWDIAFTDLAGNKLDHEIESYNPSTGDLIAWVRIPVLSAIEDTEIKILYGNSFVSSSQENAEGVWVAGYSGVWHFEDNVNDALGSLVLTDVNTSNY
ncbi:MAG: DUF2341 domain-containing protein, partial [Bacteroidales bacterium]|nr:DUF2341 domain-containing protein [Bacteroidales bacterium]